MAAPFPVGYPLAPWHLWGSSTTARLQFNGVALQQQTVQLARINYSRPETWSFLFAAQLTGAPAALAGASLIIDFDLIVGIGRSVVKLGGDRPTDIGFARLAFAWVTTAPVANLTKWTTTALAPVLDEVTPANPRELLDHFPGQDIQASARITFDGTVPLLSVATCAVHAYFAPRTHVRPEWFSDDAEQFRGREQGGT